MSHQSIPVPLPAITRPRDTSYDKSLRASFGLAQTKLPELATPPWTGPLFTSKGLLPGGETMALACGGFFWLAFFLGERGALPYSTSLPGADSCTRWDEEDSRAWPWLSQRSHTESW